MAIAGIGHINIRTPAFEETMRFYEAALGFRRGPAQTMTDPVGNAWLYAPDGRPLIHVNAPRPGDADRPGGLVGRLDHVAFDCADRAGMQARLDAAGVPYEVCEMIVPGLVQINLSDPNGIRLELTFGHEAVRMA